MKIVALVFASTFIMSAVALRPEWGGSYKFWGCLLGVYGALAGLALYRMWCEGTWREILRFRGGDLAIGFGSALVLVLGAHWVKPMLMPAQSPEQAWMAQVHILVGDPRVLAASVGLTLALLLVAACEELVWRVMVLDELMQRIGARRAWPLSAVLYALSLAPAAYTLRVEPAGLNPLLPIAGLGCGLVWAFMGRMFGRAPPLMFSHMMFSYAVATQFRLPGL